MRIQITGYLYVEEDEQDPNHPTGLTEQAQANYRFVPLNNLDELTIVQVADERPPLPGPDVPNQVPTTGKATAVATAPDGTVRT